MYINLYSIQCQAISIEITGIKTLREDRLRQAREKLGLTQRALSRICGLGDNMIYRYENGLSDITGNTLKTLASKLGVNADYLLGLSDDPVLHTHEVSLSEDETRIVETFRREGWSGVIRLGAERLPK
jgi:transcriptional regulator with XRE-family HTH domain